MGKKIDLTGKKYGSWTVSHCVERNACDKSKLKWICICKCGKEICLGSHYIRNYWNPTDCGCSRSIVGKKFNKLTVIERLGKDARHVSNYVCKCDCGNIKTYRGSYLIYEKVKSCGCERKCKERDCGKDILWNSYRRNAKKRNLEFSLSRETFDNLIKKECFYCGGINTNKTPERRSKNLGNKYLFHNGIDRIDNEEGYTLNNSVPCCKICNHMKREMTVCKWVQHIETVLQNFKNNLELAEYIKGVNKASQQSPAIAG